MLGYYLIYQLVQVTILTLQKHILDFRKQLKVTNKTPWKGANNNLDFGDSGVDAAGHLVQEGTSNGKKVYRAQDIWKFNPDEYKQKWSSYDLDSKAVLGLKILDKLGTPVIVRTPWLYR